MTATEPRHTLAEFIAENRVTMTAKPADRNPNMPDPTMTHWRCTLRCGGKRMVLVFSMGSALTGPPSIADVLDCLASDAAGVHNGETFEQWAAEYGFDADSRTAERTYRATYRQAESFARLLGNDALETLMWHTERL